MKVIPIQTTSPQKPNILKNEKASVVVCVSNLCTKEVETGPVAAGSHGSWQVLGQRETLP